MRAKRHRSAIAVASGLASAGVLLAVGSLAAGFTEPRANNTVTSGNFAGCMTPPASPSGDEVTIDPIMEPSLDSGATSSPPGLVQGFRFQASSALSPVCDGQRLAIGVKEVGGGYSFVYGTISGDGPIDQLVGLSPSLDIGSIESYVWTICPSSSGCVDTFTAGY